MVEISLIIGVIGSENAFESWEFESWDACDKWMRINRKEGFWYKIFI